MRLHIPDPEKAARKLTIVTLSFMLCWETALAFFPLKPFWRDEWCIIYNLKFKTPKMLWGQLDFTQQFPRVYLEIVKYFTSAFNYNYFSLRFPAYIAGVATIFFIWRLMKKIYPRREATSYLFVLTLVSYQVFMDYFVQIKQYELEILLTLVAIWQLLELLDISAYGVKKTVRYLFLCASFLIVPFFSYTYPIVMAPVFLVVSIQDIHLLRKGRVTGLLLKNLLLQWFPLVLCMGSLIIFYFIDIFQLMADENMHKFWEGRMKAIESGPFPFFSHFWRLFSKVGSGFVFEIVFGMLGIASFFYALSAYAKNREDRFNKDNLLRLYCLTLLLVAILLAVAGKLPLGEPKFNAFTVPAISILIIFFLNRPGAARAFREFAAGLTFILFLALAGNIFAGFFNNLTSAEYVKRVRIYLATEKALTEARNKKLPIFVTPGVGFPDDITANIRFISMPTPAGVLKSFPAYEIGDTVAIYDIKNLDDVKEYKKLSPDASGAIAGDGLNYNAIRW